MRMVQIFLFVLSALVIAPVSAWACKCPQRSTFDIQFEGKVLYHVLGEDRNDGLYPIQFQIEKPIKGVTGKEIKIYSPSVRACGMTFEAGKRYVVFAHDFALPVTLPCWGTKEIVTTPQVKNPSKYDLAIVGLTEGEKVEYVFVVGPNVAGSAVFKTQDSLKEYLARLDRGTEIVLAPGCLRRGNEPIISSPKEMGAFRKFLEEKGLKFTVIPSG